MPFQKVIGSLRAGYTVVVVASKRHGAGGGKGPGGEHTNIDGRYVLSWATNPRAALD